MNDWLLFFSLFLPRITLLVAWLCSGIPANTAPFWLEFLVTLFIPRALIIFYIITTDTSKVWLVAHVVAWVIAWFVGQAVNARRSSS